MARFLARFHISENISVLDLGGSPFIWNVAGIRPKLTILNLSKAGFCGDWFEAIEGDACHTHFPDHSFEIVFSNSVIEHLGSEERQRQFAQECMRCGKAFFVQTPNKWFPVDPHTLFPVLHWFPRVFRLLVRWSPRALVGEITPQELDDLRGLKLLSKSEMEELFPRAEILEEKFLGITKSLIAVSPAPCLSVKKMPE
jgi:Methyltransferase domain